MFYGVNNGKQKTSLHVVNAETIDDACRCKTLVTNFNHYCLGISYPELLRYHTDIASYGLRISYPELLRYHKKNRPNH